MYIRIFVKCQKSYNESEALTIQLTSYCIQPLKWSIVNNCWLVVSSCGLWV